MGTFGLERDTRNPFGILSYLMPEIFILEEGEGEGGDATFTQAEVDAKVAEAVGTHKGTFAEGFAQEIKEHPSIQRYKSAEELAKGHLELEKRIGLKGTLVPVEGSSDEVKAEFYKSIGRPEKAELYANPALDNLHEGVKTTSEQDLKAFKDKAFELGMNGTQFSKLYDWYLQLQSQRLTDWDKSQKDEHDKTSTVLRGKWGAKFEERNALVDGLVKKFGSEELFNQLHDKPNPAMMEFLHNIGSQLSEDKLGDLGRSGMGITPEQAKIEINTIMKQIDATRPDDPIYQDLLKKKDSRYKIAYPAPA